MTLEEIRAKMVFFSDESLASMVYQDVLNIYFKESKGLIRFGETNYLDKATGRKSQEYSEYEKFVNKIGEIVTEKYYETFGHEDIALTGNLGTEVE